MRHVAKYIFLLSALFFVSHSVFAEWPFDSYFQQYMQRIGKESVPIFVSTCNLEHGRTMRKAILVFPLGDKNGVFIYSDGQSIINLTTLTWNGGDWKIGDLLGGVYTINKMDLIINKLRAATFRIMRTRSASVILSVPAIDTCQ